MDFLGKIVSLMKLAIKEYAPATVTYVFTESFTNFLFVFSFEDDETVMGDESLF